MSRAERKFAEAMNRMIDPITRRIKLMIGRCLLMAVDNSLSSQRVHVQGLGGITEEGIESLSYVERMQPYGMDSIPKAGAEVLVLFKDGNREFPLGIVVQDRRYRPTDLADGEVCLYGVKDVDGAQRILFDDDGNIVIKTKGVLQLRANSIEFIQET